MSIEDALTRAGAKPAGKRPHFLNPEVERVLAITMAAVQELAVARQRIDTLERLLDAKGVVTRSDIDTFTPTPGAYAERALWTQEYLARVLRYVQQEGEAISIRDDLSSQEVSIEVAKEEASDQQA